MMKLTEGNGVVFDSVCKAHSVICKHSNIACSISGGKDSDIVLDLISKLDTLHKVRYVWFDTGLEYQATKEHLDYLEKKYGITIERVRSVKSIPVCCKEYGQPFISKMVSGCIYSLQRNNFQWEDEPLEVLLERYPKCASAIKWWCNAYGDYQNHKYCMFDISYNRYLKEFLIANPPTFKISANCCKYAKKKTSAKLIKDNDFDLMIIGVRKAEKGVRSVHYKNCFTPVKDSADKYRPIFWYSNLDISSYDDLFDLVHSDCYSKYGMTRTGCVGCPFNVHLNDDLEVIQQYEPNLYKAVSHIFKDSYEYTRMYRDFAKQMKSERKE